MKLEAPPPRQRVIERDGRLVVIDGGAPTPPRATTAGKRGERWFEQTSFDGRGILTTRAWYDLKGPRRLELDPWSGKIARVGLLAIVVAALALIAAAMFLPWLLIAIPALAQPKLWKNARAKLTERLDRFPAPEPSAPSALTMR